MQTNIGVSVKEILKSDTLKGSEVICGQTGLENNITTVNVIEVPDIINWVKKGEFLLTTAYSIRDDILKLNEWIPHMKKIGVAGIGIKTKRYIESLPETVIQTANTLGFPIISIPFEVSFGDVITSILTNVVNRQMDLLIQIDNFNNKIKDIMLGGGDLKAIATMIYDVVNAPIAITEHIFKDYVLVADFEKEKELRGIVENGFINQAGKRCHIFNEQNIEVGEDFIGEEKVKRLTIPIYSANTFYGYVVIWDTNQTISQTMLFMIEAAVSLIALNSAKKLSVYENENKHRIEFIEDLLSVEEGDQIRAIEKASYFDFHKANIYGVVVVSLQNGSSDIQYTKNNSEILKQLNGKLISVVQRMQRYYRGEIIYGNKSDRVIFLLGFNREKEQEEIKKEMTQFSKDILNFSRLEAIENKLFIGIGRSYNDYKELYKSYREANRAIQNLFFFTGKERIFHFDDLGIYRILSNEDIQPELQQFFTETLGPIVVYDKGKDAELLRTLKCYFDCGCNLKRVSEEMYTHYNTIIYRMQRIKEIGNLDLSDPNVALNVHIALKAIDVLAPNFLEKR